MSQEKKFGPLPEYRTFPIKWEFDKMGIWAPKNLQSSSRWNGNSIKWEGCSAFCSKLEIYTKFRNSNFQILKMSKMLSSWILLKLTLYGGYPSEQLSSNLQHLGSSQSWCSRLHFFSTVVDNRNLLVEFSKFQILNFQIWASFLSNTGAFGPNVWQMGFSEEFAVWFAIKWEFDKMGIFSVFRYNES